MRLPTIAAIVCTVVLMPLSGCTRNYARVPAPRAAETVFSPLMLPAPNSLRTQTGVPGPDYWQQRVDYELHATLEPETKTVRGHGRMRYTNHSPDELTYLWLHLEQNLYREDSAGALLAQQGSEHRDPDDITGGLEIEYVRMGGVDVPLQVYDTVGRIDLPQPLEPRGGVVELEMRWSFRVPKLGDARMGWEELRDGVVFQVAQWFPAACVYDDVHGWNTLPYLGAGEFYSNFGDYDVRISVPREHLVAATGVLCNAEQVLTADQLRRLQLARGSAETVLIRSSEEVGKADSRPAGDGPLTWQFHARDVRTFAWASSAAFIWDAAGLPSSGAAAAEEWCGQAREAGTLVQSFYPAEALPLWGFATEMLRFSVEHYSRQWLPYPYPTATNVNGRAPGMEYPMIIFCSERRNERELFGVTTHEIGHTWFPMVVNSDERRYAWMDEGFNTFINIYAMAGWRKSWLDPRKAAADLLAGAQHTYQPTATWPDQLGPGALGVLEYDKVAVALYTLREKVLGPERFDAAFRGYVRAWAFKSPQPADFFRHMENAAGRELSWFWRSWLLEAGTLDQAVQSVRQDAQEVHAVFVNQGTMVMPLELRIEYRDGTRETRTAPAEVWYAADRCELRWPRNGRQVRSIEIDPDGVLPDANRGNNRWSGW